MFKKIVFTSLISMMSAASFAERPASLKQDNSTYVSTGTTYVGASTGIPLSSGEAVSGDIFAGHGKTFGSSQRFYLGGEINAGVNHFKSQYDWPSATTYSLGASIIPGIMLTPTVMAYGRAGLNMSKYKNHVWLGQVFGLGLQKDLNKNWGVRGEYTLSSNIATQGQASLGLTYKLD
ncbi:MAG: hypothetical protein V4501_05835 [Pseudomonadota bacterium]